jgi:hypothetical protein
MRLLLFAPSSWAVLNEPYEGAFRYTKSARARPGLVDSRRAHLIDDGFVQLPERDRSYT